MKKIGEMAGMTRNIGEKRSGVKAKIAAEETATGNSMAAAENELK